MANLLNDPPQRLQTAFDPDFWRMLLDWKRRINAGDVVTLTHISNTSAHGATGDIVGDQDYATTLAYGVVKQASAVADLNQTIAGPSIAEVQAISDKVDELLAALRTAGVLNT
jgi:hypothetical protein